MPRRIKKTAGRKQKQAAARELTLKIDKLANKTAKCTYNKAKKWRFTQKRAAIRRQIKTGKYNIKPLTKRQSKILSK